MTHALRWLGAGLMLGLPMRPVPVHAVPQALKVTQARLDRDVPSAGDTGRVMVRAIVDDSAAATETFATALLSNAVTVAVNDAGQFAVTVPLTACRDIGVGIWCATDTVRAWIKRSRVPSRYRLRLSVRQLNTAVTGTVLSRMPVTVTVRWPGSAELVDVISDCAPAGPYQLACSDRDRPNIIFIVTDDQRWDSVQYMPRTLDRLASKGVSFTNAFVPTPLCAPSRMSMLTGRYARHHGVLTTAGPGGWDPAVVDADTSTLATWLHDAGYRTGMYGKYMVGYTAQCPPLHAACYRPPGWDEWHVFWTQHYYGYTLNENGMDVSYGSDESDYSTDVLTAKAVEFIRSARGQPFFLHIGYHAPHGEGLALGFSEPAARHAHTFTGFPPLIPRPLPPWQPPSWDEPDITDKPSWFAAHHRAADPVTDRLTWGGLGEGGRLLQLETTLAVDEGVDSIVAALEATGQADDTIIVLTSDNGFFWGEHRLFGGKDYPYEESLRIPLVIRYPRWIASARNEPALVLNIDIAPTLARLAGVQPSRVVDGMDLGPLLRQETASVRDAFPIEWWNLSGRSDLSTYVGIRTADWKYVTYPDAGEKELYHLASDPYELDNRADNADYQDEVATLQTRLDALLAAGEGDVR